jgi:DNA-binding NtrC family response regulator
VVEDEEGVRVLVRTILAAHGYTVLEAARGKEALKLLADRTTPVDLIITDVVMPEMSGRELALGAVRLSPGTKVLYMSGYTDEAIVQHGVLDPGIPFLQKPFTHDALTTKIREVLEGVLKASY